MRIGIYAVYDKVADDIPGGLRLYANETLALRHFGEILLHPNSQLAQHAKDLDLIELAILQIGEGDLQIEGHEAPHTVINGANLLKRINAQTE